MDRLIIDSSSWENSAASFILLREAMQANDDLVVQDLAWTRSWQFRVGLASLFDDAIARQCLPGINNVEIIHHPAHRNTALQLVAWLAVQAGWKDAEDDKNLVLKSGEQIAVNLVADEDSPPLGALRIFSPSCKVSIVREKGSSHVQRSIESPCHKASSLSPADPCASEELVAQQLSRGGKNSLYQKILPRFLAMLGR